MAAAKTHRSKRSASSRVGLWREHHRWCFMASIERLLKHPYGTLMTILVMGVALALPLAFWVLLGNVQHMAGSLGSTPVINVYFSQDADQDQVKKAADKWQDNALVESVHIVSPDDGMRELGQMYGFADVLETLENNPLPYVVTLTPASTASADDLQVFIDQAEEQSEVAEVQDDRAWRERLGALVGVTWRLVTLMSILLGLAAALVVGNSIRLDIQSRREEIGVLQLVGASHAFVRRPYLYAGIWYGVISGVVASLLVLLLGVVVHAPVERLLLSYEGELPVSGLLWWQWFIMPVLAGLLGWLAARVVSGYSLRSSH